MRSITKRCAIALTLAAAAAGQHAVAAQASSPALVYTGGREAYGGVMTFEAGADTANRVRVWRSGSDVHISDAGGAVTADLTCSQLTSNEVSCPADAVKQLWVGLGDRDDSLTSSLSVRLHVAGGNGNDRLSGYVGDDTLDGGAGDDALQGGSGVDALSGDDGADDLDGGFGKDALNGGVGTDVLDGGPGSYASPWYSPDSFDPSVDGGDVLSGGSDRDRADFSTHQRYGVAIAINDIADDGTWGERDNVRTDVEHVTGSHYNDAVYGSAAPNTLAGGAGDDALHGLAGNDRLTGEAGVDRLFGGEHDDTLDAHHADADGRVDCGTGTDLAAIDRGDPVIACESVLAY